MPALAGVQGNYLREWYIKTLHGHSREHLEKRKKAELSDDSIHEGLHVYLIPKQRNFESCDATKYEYGVRVI